MAASDKDIKKDVLKSMIDYFKKREVDSWKGLFDEKKPEEKEDESEDSEEECEECEGKGCKACGKPKGVAVIEETVIIGKPKK